MAHADNRSLLEKRRHVIRLQQEFSWCQRTVLQRSGTLEVAGCVQVSGFTCWPPKSSVSERGLLGYGTFLLCEEGAILLPWPHSKRLVPIRELLRASGRTGMAVFD